MAFILVPQSTVYHDKLLQKRSNVIDCGSIYDIRNDYIDQRLVQYFPKSSLSNLHAVDLEMESSIQWKRDIRNSKTDARNLWADSNQAVGSDSQAVIVWYA
jgi:conjugal transfer/entry exclusion protein